MTHLRIHEPFDVLGPAEGGEPIAMGRGGNGQGDRFGEGPRLTRGADQDRRAGVPHDVEQADGLPLRTRAPADDPILRLGRKSGVTGKSSVRSSFLPEKTNRHRAKKLGRGG